MNDKTTVRLDAILKSTDSIDELGEYLDAETYDDISFYQYFFSLEEVKKYESVEIIELSGIERSYFYQIAGGTRKPGRDKVIRLSLACRLDDVHTQRALDAARVSRLNPKVKRDAIVLYAVRSHLSVFDTQDLLKHFNEPYLE